MKTIYKAKTDGKPETVGEVFKKFEDKMRKIYEHGYSKKEMMSVFMQYSDQAQKEIEGMAITLWRFEDLKGTPLKAIPVKSLLGEDKETK